MFGRALREPGGGRDGNGGASRSLISLAATGLILLAWRVRLTGRAGSVAGAEESPVLVVSWGRSAKT